MREVQLPAFAKINLRLEILGKRADGYHELRTIFQTVSLHDDLRLRRTKGREVTLAVKGNEGLSREPTRMNLAFQAVEALRRELHIRLGVEIELTKRIPAGRGLGGGSSDAAVALRGFLRLTGKKLPEERLMEIGASLGADVPFFLRGGRTLGIGRGDEIYPLPDIEKLAILIVSPREIHVPTADAYRWVRAPELTKQAENPKLWRFCALCWSLQGSGLANDFEGPVFRRHKRLEKIKRQLLQGGAREASLAGSGSAVFGIFPSPAKARRAAVGFPQDQTFVCESISRQKYVRLIQGRRG